MDSAKNLKGSSISAMEIWRLWVGGEKNLGLIPHDLTYFATHFTGDELPADWQPPPVKIQGKSKRLRDFVSWMVAAPVVSAKARDALAPIVANDVQFLRFHRIRDREYFAMNVVCKMNILDRERSELTFADEDRTRILDIKSAHFSPNAEHSLPAVFKLHGGSGDIFVTRPFVDVVLANKLTGVSFGDPKQNIFRAIVRREAINIVPGVIE
jgi:hypothetical protein